MARTRRTKRIRRSSQQPTRIQDGYELGVIRVSDYVPYMRHELDGANADGRMRVLLRMHCLPDNAQAESRRLLRVLLLR